MLHSFGVLAQVVSDFWHLRPIFLVLDEQSKSETNIDAPDKKSLVSRRASDGN